MRRRRTRRPGASAISTTVARAGVALPFGGASQDVMFGPLRASTTFSKKLEGSALLIDMSGTGFENTSGVLADLDESVSGPEFSMGEGPATEVFFNHSGEHRTLPTAHLVVPAGPAGTYTLTVSVDPTHLIASDGGDRYFVSVVEFVPAG